MSSSIVVSLVLSMVASLNILAACTEGSAKPDLYIASLLSYPDPHRNTQFHGKATWSDGHGIAPAVRLAVEQINNRSDILSDYNLKLIENREGCNYTPVTYLRLLETTSSVVITNQVLVGIIGPRCSESALAVAPVIRNGRVSTISIHYGTKPRLGDRMLYPYSFGVLDSVSPSIEALVDLIAHNKWRDVSTVYVDTDVHYVSAYQEFTRRLERMSGYTITQSVSVSEFHLPLQVLQGSQTRVMLAFTGPQILLKLLCEIYHNQLTFPTYQWVFLGRQPLNLNATTIDFTDRGRQFRCSENELREAANGALILSLDLEVANDTMTYSGQTYSEYSERYGEMVGSADAPRTIWANPAYDATWALALAVNASDKVLKQTRNLSILDYNNHRELTTKIIADQLYRVRFTGVSGMIGFNHDTGFTARTLHLHQNLNDSTQTIGYYNGTLLVLSDTAIFISGEFSTETVHTVPLPIAIAVLVIISIPLLLTVLTQILSIVYRRYRPIKASSFRLNQLAYIGFYVATFGMVASTVVETFHLGKTVQNALCVIVPWTLNTGLTLILGTMCVKSWRLYYILAASSKLKQVTNQLYLKDKTLSLAVLALGSIDIIICGLWTILDQPTWSEHSTQLISSKSVPVHRVVTTCVSKYMDRWSSAEIAYKALISLTAFTFILYGTQKNHRKGFDAKNVIILAYVQAIITGIAAPSAIIVNLRNRDSDTFVPFAILSGYFTIILYLCTAVLFAPPLIVLFRQKWNNKLNSSFWSTHPPRRRVTNKSYVSSTSVSFRPTSVLFSQLKPPVDRSSIHLDNVTKIHRTSRVPFVQLHSEYENNGMYFVSPV